MLVAGMPNNDACEWALEGHWAFLPPAVMQYAPLNGSPETFTLPPGGGAVCVETDTPREGEPPARPSWLEPYLGFPGDTGVCGEVYESTDAARILDFQAADSSIYVDDTRMVTDVNVLVDIRHSYTGDLLLTLTAPNGAFAVLSAGSGASANFVSAHFDDDAAESLDFALPPFTGSRQPESPLAALTGQSAQGAWTLEVSDFGEGDTGALNHWRLQLNCTGAQGDGEGGGEGAAVGWLSSDTNADFQISLNELLRTVQLYNASGFHCADPPSDTEDGYVPGAGANRLCPPHTTDYNPQDWAFSLGELLRTVQFFNLRGYYPCPSAATEDGFCPGEG
ncbi:MAG: hypothetical protein GC168_13195 [Candidatus Hydrogenedens sp.]|nr:hypothetical protein [Candidatus Hydrogenedens sp.]